MREYTYFQPKSLDELFSLVKSAEGSCAFVAGGTDVVPRLNYARQQIPAAKQEPLNLIYLGSLGLNTIKDSGKELCVGACVTLSALAENGTVRAKLPALAQALELMAGLSVRNIATIGGNIMNASPAADTAPPLQVLGAVFTLASSAGSRDVPAAQFFTGPGKTVAKPGEILTGVKIPYGNGSSAFEKLGRRKAETLSVASAAAYAEVTGGVFGVVRLSLGSVGPTVIVSKAGAALAGKPATEASIGAAAAAVAAEIQPIDDVRGSAWYRKEVTPVLAKRALLKAAGLGGT